MNGAKTPFPAEGPQARQYVAGDCVVFEGRCFCHNINKNAEMMVAEALAAGKKKVVVFGDCDDHYDGTAETLAGVMAAAEIEHAWFPEEISDYDTDAAVPGFSETRILCFDEAARYAALRKTVGWVGQRVNAVRRKIDQEERLLAQYPAIAKLVSIESEDNSAAYSEPSGFEVLFGGHRKERTLVSKTSAIALFNIEAQRGVIVTDSTAIEFTVPPAYGTVPGVELDILQGTRKGREKGYTTNHGGSVHVTIGGEKATTIKLYCYPGIWTLCTHPTPEGDPNAKYIPMWERVTRQS